MADDKAGYKEEAWICHGVLHRISGLFGGGLLFAGAFILAERGEELMFEGKTAVVTGAGKGLGQAMSAALARAGADIIGVDIGDMTKTAEIIEKDGGSFTPVSADLSKTDEIPELAKKLEAVYGKVDILVNNAGVIYRSPAEEYPEDGFDFVMNLNVKALFLLSREIGGYMKTRRWGRIINVCSIQSMQGGNGVSAYAASKHAVAGITRAFANEWGKYGITVNGIAPGYIVTDNTDKLRAQKEKAEAITARIPAGRWGQPSDLMGPVVFLASDEAAYVNGHLLVVDGGYMNA